MGKQKAHFLKSMPLFTFLLFHVRALTIWAKRESRSGYMVFTEEKKNQKQSPDCSDCSDSSVNIYCINEGLLSFSYYDF